MGLVQRKASTALNKYNGDDFESLTSNWTLEKQGSKRVELTGMNDKRQIT